MVQRKQAGDSATSPAAKTIANGNYAAQDAIGIVATLGRVLAIDSWTCQSAALHGLGHSTTDSQGLEAYQFDFRSVRILQNTTDRIAIQLPDLIKDKRKMATGVVTSGGKRVGNLGGATIGDDKNQVFEEAEILAIDGSEITFLVGFERLPPIQKQ